MSKKDRQNSLHVPLHKTSRYASTTNVLPYRYYLLAHTIIRIGDFPFITVLFSVYSVHFLDAAALLSLDGMVNKVFKLSWILHIWVPTIIHTHTNIHKTRYYWLIDDLKLPSSPKLHSVVPVCSEFFYHQVRYRVVLSPLRTINNK